MYKLNYRARVLSDLRVIVFLHIKNTIIKLTTKSPYIEIGTNSRQFRF
jgi:hypothetical protein